MCRDGVSAGRDVGRCTNVGSCGFKSMESTFKHLFYLFQRQNRRK